MRGYKVFNPDWSCRGFMYEVGKTFTHEGSIEPCARGFHFCEKVQDCFNYYNFDPANKVAEVEALGEIKSDDDKFVTDKLHIVREVTWHEMLAIANLGKGNTGHSNAGHYNAGHYNAGNRNAGHYNAGHYNAGNRNAGHYNAGHYNAGNRNAGNRNAGDYNAGHYNAGHYNAGHYNAGHYNAGHYNAGHYNAGHYNAGHYNAGHYNAGHYNAGNRNAGHYNAGHYNAGHYNAGDFNSCNYSSGSFCSVEPEFLLFNKPSPITREDFTSSRAYYLCRRLSVVDDEGNKIEYKQAWSNLWNSLDNDQKICIQSMPNFDAAVFEEITGIQV